MRYLALLLCLSCATVPTRPAPDPEQMPEGRRKCRAMCAKVGRAFEEYRYNGDCVCKAEGDL